MKTAILCLLLMATGCAKPGRHFIFGFGIVDIEKPANATTVVKSTVIGIHGSDRKVVAGVSRSVETRIPLSVTNLVLELHE